MIQHQKGRPRDSETTERILKAAATQILEGGFDSLNYEALATSAKTSRSTIYRRWPTKLDLGIEVMERLASIGTMPNTGDVVADLTEHCLQTTRNHSQLASVSNPADIWTTILHPDIARAYNDRIGRYRRQNGLAIIAGAVARGDLPENVDSNLILDAMAGYVLFRSAYANHSVSHVQVAALAQSLCSSPPVFEPGSPETNSAPK